ncbi:MAG: hypothetical protein U0169_14750 [Polyangiaceae bacterium]
MKNEENKGLQFRIVYPDGKVDKLVVDSDNVLVGSGAHCEIRLPREKAAVEHVAVTMVGGGVHAQARALDPLPTVNGSGFMQSPLLADAAMGIGDVQIFVEVVSIEGGADVIRKNAQKTSPITYVAALLAIPLAGYILLVDEEDGTSAPAPKDVPALWGEPVRTCREQAPDQALASAIERKVVAEGRRERRPFHVQDGVAAVPIFETAAACFTQAGKPDLAKDAEADAVNLRARVTEDYRAHQVRLEHALTVQDFPTAQKEVRVLRAFTEGLGGSYVVWLSNLERQLKLRQSRKDS